MGGSLMFRPTLLRCLAVAVASLLAFATTSSMWAQTESKPTQKAAATKFRGRLPNNYARLVTPKQRAEIYAIQEQYHAQIEELETQLEELKRKQSDEIYAVLTPEQKATLNVLQGKSKTPANSETASSKASTEE
jgi:hypothetical protein